MKMLMLAAALALAPLGAAGAVPADVAAAVSAPGRPAEATALDAGRRPAEILRFAGLERGDRALDLFTGNGYYGEIMARAVGPRGSVLGWNPTAFTGDESRQALAAARQRSPNFNFVVTQASGFALPSAAFDFAMINLNYHDTYFELPRRDFRMEPEAFLRAVFQSLKPGGTIAVIDHVANPGGETRAVVSQLHRIDPATVRADFERAGFVFDGESDLLRNPGDDHSKSVFDPSIRGRTDRFVYRFRRPR
ncbi:MAG TPA: methyltransferase domain-containing protein [Allosphingosinicella sp.]|nr:methyltransferase domain-containing protein [Allosphingosinicella sp.]